MPAKQELSMCFRHSSCLVPSVGQDGRQQEEEIERKADRMLSFKGAIGLSFFLIFILPVALSCAEGLFNDERKEPELPTITSPTQPRAYALEVSLLVKVC